MKPHVMMEVLKLWPNPLRVEYKQARNLMGIKFGKFTSTWSIFNLAIMSEVFLYNKTILRLLTCYYTCSAWAVHCWEQRRWKCMKWKLHSRPSHLQEYMEPCSLWKTLTLAAISTIHMQWWHWSCVKSMLYYLICRLDTFLEKWGSPNSVHILLKYLYSESVSSSIHVQVSDQLHVKIGEDLIWQ